MTDQQPATGDRPEIHRPLALERAAEALRLLAVCRLCPHACGADRTQHGGGVCGCGPVGRLFRDRVDWAGEEELVPTLVFNFSGCNLRCDFCVTGEQSQDGSAGEPFEPAAVAAHIARFAGRIRTMTIEGGEPTANLPSALEMASLVPTDMAVVWKTNAFASPVGLELLDGVVDVALPDFKFGNDACALRLAGVIGYVAAARNAVEWMNARLPRLIVRHLVMPGHLECCTLPLLDYMADQMPGVPLSLMTGFLPKWKFALHPEFSRLVTRTEADRAREEARARGLNLLRWSLDARPGNDKVQADEIWIDRDGRLCVNFASAELISCLKRLGPELDIAL